MQLLSLVPTWDGGGVLGRYVLRPLVSEGLTPVLHAACIDQSCKHWHIQLYSYLPQILEVESTSAESEAESVPWASNNY